MRLELAEVARPVVRVLELASDMYLDEVSDVVQAAFGWLGYHLHRFAIGDPFGIGVEPYLCPFEVDEGEAEGLDARQVRLDELLAEGTNGGAAFDADTFDAKTTSRAAPWKWWPWCTAPVRPRRGHGGWRR